MKQVKKRYFKIMKLMKIASVAVSEVFDMLEKYYPKIC